MRMQPVVFVWQEVEVVDGDGVAIRRMAMVPHPRYGNVVKRQFHDGEKYALAPVEERSMASHNQYFAALNDGFNNLPERVAFEMGKDGKFKFDEQGHRIPRWPTAEHVRKWLLIESGWYEEKDFDFDSQSQAKRLGAFIRVEDVYARIGTRQVEDAQGRPIWKVIIRRARSQSLTAMGKEDFQASKKAVLDLVEAMIGVKPGSLMKEAGRNP